MARRIPPAEGEAALTLWRESTATDADAALPRTTLATAVRHTLAEFARRHPGRSVEVRVPPFGVVQCMSGTVHRRGVPPAVVEMPAASWLAIVTGRASWAEEVAAGRISASGERADLSSALPMLP